MATFIVEGRLCAWCFLKPLHSSAFTHHHASTSQRVSIQRLRTYLFHSFKAITEPDDIFYNETQTMPGLLMNGDTHHNSTTASNPSSSDDEHTNGNGNQYTYFDIFNLPPPQDGHFHLVLVDAITDLAFAQRDRIIGMTLEVVKRLFIFHRYHAN